MSDRKKRKYGKVKQNFWTGSTWIEYEPWELQLIEIERAEEYKKFCEELLTSPKIQAQIKKLAKERRKKK